MYSVSFRLPPEHAFAEVINVQLGFKDANVDPYRSDNISSSVFIEEVGGVSMYRKCVAKLNEETGKFDVTSSRDYRGLRWLANATGLNRIFNALGNPDAVTHSRGKKMDFSEALAVVKLYETKCREFGLEVHEDALTIPTHYTFAQAFEKDREPLIKIEPEAFIGRPEPVREPGCDCRCYR